MSVRLFHRPQWPTWTRSAALVVSGGLCLGCRTGGSSVIVPTSGEVAYESASVDPASYAECPDPAECKRPCDFPKDAIPDVPGTYVQQWNDAMIAGGDGVSSHVVSEHEWYDGGVLLGPEGRRHVRGLADDLADPTLQIIVEAADVAVEYDQDYTAALLANEQLNEQRRLAVVEELLAQGIADANARVLVQPIERIGVHGIESPRVYNSGLSGGFGNRQGQGGFGTGGGGLGGGVGFGGGGFGGGGGGFF